jgi:hypothetical protein
MKTCTRCNLPKTLEEFVKDKRSLDGRAERCLLCERERVKAWSQTARGKTYQRGYNVSRPKEPKQLYDRDRYEKDRVGFITKTQKQHLEKSAFMGSLKSYPCLDCGISFPPGCMDFDHVRGVKKFKLSRMVMCTRETILAEIRKCDLVCANCHRIRTDSRKPVLTLPWKVRLRAKFNALKAGPCTDCKGTFSPSAMEFDHVRGQKLVSLGNMFGLAWHRVLAEVSKCEVVCSNCHRVRTHTRQGGEQAA